MSQADRKSARLEWNRSSEILSLTGVPIIDCIVKDISVTGARVMVEVPEVLPDYFKLRVDADEIALFPNCRVRWRAGNEVGIEFFR